MTNNQFAFSPVSDTCDFESGLCNWQQVVHTTPAARRYRRDPGDNQYLWSRVQGNTVQTSDYRAKLDHTSNSGAGML